MSAKRLSDNMICVLQLALNGEDLFSGCSGWSEHGGRASVITALCRRGLLKGGKITDQGRETLKTVVPQGRA